MGVFMRIAGPLALGGLVASAAVAASHVDPAAEKAVKARQAQMTLYSFNLGTLGGMAQDKIPYDAAMATTSATNLAALAALDQTGYWPEGTEATAVEGSEAKVDIWTDMADFDEHKQALVTATATLASAAGTDLDSLKAAFGDVGKACGSCHETYRVEND